MAPVLHRVTERRIEWLADLLREGGVSPAAASRRARLLYSADLGLFQVREGLAEGTPDERELRSLSREIVDAFLR